MNNIDVASPAVLSYLDSLQSVISRMASNSTACKTWCITLVSAVIVFASDKNKPDSVWISLVPVGLFFVLDAYYLGLERQFRALYNGFVSKLRSNTAAVDDLFRMAPDLAREKVLQSMVRAGLSVSVWPFYGLVAAMLAVLRSWIF